MEAKTNTPKRTRTHAPARFNGRRFVAGEFIPRRDRMETDARAHARSPGRVFV